MNWNEYETLQVHYLIFARFRGSKLSMIQADSVIASSTNGQGEIFPLARVECNKDESF